VIGGQQVVLVYMPISLPAKLLPVYPNAYPYRTRGDNPQRMVVKKRRIAIVMGTRPEAIKLAPVVRTLRQHRTEFDVLVVATGQHRQMLDQVLSLFQIAPDVDLDVMQPNQGLADLTAAVCQSLARWLDSVRPDLLIVQGDTTSAFAAALTAFYARVPVAHVEAGLRTNDLERPFPEEASRRLTAVITRIHFAPTSLARQNLLHEGVLCDGIAVTGNTIVDSLLSLLASGAANLPLPVATDHHRLLLVTSHRREAWGPSIESICLAIRDLVERFPDLLVVYPVHMNPNVRHTVDRLLNGVDRIRLIAPVDYPRFIAMMVRADLILTDSGGVQEEAPTLGKPLLAVRDVTERPEAFHAGLAKLIGTRREVIVEEVTRILLKADGSRSVALRVSPYGDGRAAERIASALVRWSKGYSPLLDPEQEFSASAAGTA
jgi:UDP-N-acetylglucosamine 2-epimerase (non-hydrolysing)